MLREPMGLVTDISRRLVPAGLRPRLRQLYYRGVTPAKKRAQIARDLRGPGGAELCRSSSSPLYAHLLEQAAADVESSGPFWRLLEPEFATSFDADGALPLKLMGAVHRLVLEGKAPELAAYYPSAGGDGDPEAAWPAFRATVADHEHELRPLLKQAVQTNDVARCATLVGGFMLIAQETGLPLHLLEMGASAGLNLRWDRYRYDLGGLAWGDPGSPVRLGSEIVEGTPPFDVQATVAGRAGCDVSPIDPCSREGQLVLSSFIWADQTERLELLRGAFEIAAAYPVDVEQADGPTWLESELAKTRPGVATVVFHSFVLMYISTSGRERLRRAFALASAAATASAPFAWLRMEGADEGAELWLTVWPDGVDRLIAVSAAHGADVRWLPEDEWSTRKEYLF